MAATASPDAAALALLRERNGRMHSAASIARGRAFVPRPTDVFVATYPKCGTTWVTAICHALRAPDHQDFDEITTVAPWDIVALDCGQDMDADQVANPRIFKSHEAYGDIAKGAKYVYVIRHPADAFVSFYNFLPKYMQIPDGELTVETFAEGIFGGLSHSGGIWSHFADWIDAARRDPDRILVVAFEDLKADLAREIDRIARFVRPELVGVGDASSQNGGSPSSSSLDALCASAREVSTYAYMSSHASQFDDHFVFGKLRAQIGLEATHRATKVNKGAVGGRKDLPALVADMLDTRWQSTVEPRFPGCASYDDLRRFVRDLNKQHHPSKLDD